VRLRAGWAVGLVVLVRALPGRAEPTATEKAMATQLFEDAELLSTNSQYAGACPKYAESQRLDPQLGTLLHLADCYEKVGKTASAWASFKEATEVAVRRNAAGNNEPREKVARARAAALESKLSRLTITVAKPDLAGLEVLQDGYPVGRAMWGSAVPVDPGQHTVTAKAPRNKTWTKTFDVGPDGVKVAVVVPLLEAEPAGAPPAAAPQASPFQATAAPASAETAAKPGVQRTIAYVVAGVGGAALLTGTVFALMRTSALSERDQICPSNRCTRDEASRIDDLTDKAKSNATVANVAFGIGGAAIVGGVVLYFTAPRTPSTTPTTGLRVQPWVAPTAAGAAIGGVW